MQLTMSAFTQNFLGHAPDWYKKTIVAFLVLNPILLAVAGPYITGWALVLEFIFTLAMALKCYPLQPGGLLAIEGVVMGIHGSRYLLHERAAAVHLYQGAAFHSLENADFLFVLVYFGFFIRIS